MKTSPPASASSSERPWGTADAPAPQRSVEALTARTLLVATQLARLGSAAQFFTGLRRHRGAAALRLLEPFNKARAALGALQQAVRLGLLVDADEILCTVERDATQLRSLVLEADREVGCDALAGYLNGTHTLTTEKLARLVEFYALDPDERSADRCRKFLDSALALARRDGLEETDAPAVSRLFRQRRLLAGVCEDGFPLEVPLRAVALRQRMLDSAQQGPGTQEQLRAEVSRFEDDLGAELYTPLGLAEAVALELSLERRTTLLERADVRPFDSLVGSLEAAAAAAPAWEADPSLEPAAGLAEQELLTETLVQTIEVELLQGVMDGSHAEMGLNLGLDELEAARARADATTADRLLLRSASCRVAVDRTARGLAQYKREGHPDEGDWSRAAMLGLVSLAARIERDLTDENQNALVHGRLESAKRLTRSLHRLSRSRLGLALLADVPVSGRPSPDEPKAATAQVTAEDERRLVAELEAARTMRDALMGAGAQAPDQGATIQLELPSLTSNSRKVRKPLLVALATVALITAGFHLSTRVGLAPASHFDLNDVVSPIPLVQAAPLKGTFIATTDVDWAALSDAERENHVRLLWESVQAKNFANMMLTSEADNQPLAYASGWELQIFPFVPPALAP